MKGWEKKRLTDGMDFDDRVFEEPDNEEEILLQDAMDESMIDSNTEDLEVEETVVVPIEADNNGQQKTTQKKPTDFFQSKK